MRITISIPEEAVKEIEDLRIRQYPHCKKISKMMLQITMDKVREEKPK